MEFKGTKGKWVIDNEEVFINESGVLVTPISIENFMIGFIDVYGDQPEDKANALLISKAPEMLDMLQHVSDKLNGNGFHSLQFKIDELIKEATKIN